MSGDQEGKQHNDKAGAYEDVSQETQNEVDEMNAGETSELDVRVQEAVEIALADQRDSVLRAHAEVQNMRRRCESDVEKAHKFALERFSGELLPVVDNLERALDVVPQEQADVFKPFCEGVELTLKSFLEVLSKYGVQQHSPLGEPFDPQLHQAVASVPSPDVEPNTVIDVMQKGYTLNGRVMRPAMVAVSKSE